MLSIAASILKKLAIPMCFALFWWNGSWASNRPGACELPISASLKKGCRATLTGRENRRPEAAFDAQTDFAPNSLGLIRLLSENSQNSLEKRKAIDANIENLTRKVRKYSTAEKAVISDLNQTARRLNDLSLQRAKNQTELAGIEIKTSQLQKKSVALAQHIQELEKDVSQRLIALYKLYRLGQINVLGSARSIHEFIQRKNAFQYILADDQRLMQTLSDARNRMESLIRDLAFQKNEKARIQEELQIQKETLNAENAQREKILIKIQNDKMLALAAIDAHKEAAEKLDRKIENYAVEPSLPLEKYTSDEDFTKLKGLLNMPVKGIIAGAFGHFLNPRFNVENFRSGIEIKAEKGEPVRAVCKGRVLYAQWFQNYGNMIIIDHGHGYYTVYAYAEELFKARGDLVESGEVIATVGNTGSMAECALYFEIRRNGKPVNPDEWIRKS